MKKTKFTPARLGDYLIFCDICGQQCWASEATILDKYTGKGNCVVCPSDIDAIDYALVPYKIPAEKSVPITRDAIHLSDPGFYWIGATRFPFDYINNNPLNTTPQQNANLYLTWDQLNLTTWDKWTTLWGQGDKV